VLILPVGFSVIANDPVSVCRGCSTGVCRCDLSANVVVEAFEQTLAEVHVTNGVDWLTEVNSAGQLSIARAPVVLNALQVPLIDEHDDLLTLRLVDQLEQILVSLVNEDFLDLREEDLSGLNVPVDEVLIKTLLSECLRASLGNLGSVADHLLSVWRLSVHETAPEIVRYHHASLVEETLCGVTVHLGAEELELGTDLFGGLTSKLDLKAWEPESEVATEAEMELEGLVVEGPASKEDELSGVPVVFEPFVSTLVEVALVPVELFLRVNILEKLGLIPPAIIAQY
jgi:hypothetical protein